MLRLFLPAFEGRQTNSNFHPYIFQFYKENMKCTITVNQTTNI